MALKRTGLLVAGLVLAPGVLKASPSVASVSPNRAVQKTYAYQLDPITITGSGFVSPVTVEIRGISLQITYFSPSLIKVRAMIPAFSSGIVSGKRDVTVTNPDLQSGSLIKGFELDRFDDKPATDPFALWDWIASTSLTEPRLGYTRTSPIMPDAPPPGFPTDGITTTYDFTQRWNGTPNVLRRDMARFIVRGRNEGPYDRACVSGHSAYAADVPCDDPDRRWIDRLYFDNLTVGCGGGNFCPNATVPREQMAVFIETGIGHAAATDCDSLHLTFQDVPCTSGYWGWIEQLARDGITGGCGGGNFCPAGLVPRDQMAVFVSAAFGVTAPSADRFCVFDTHCGPGHYSLSASQYPFTQDIAQALGPLNSSTCTIGAPCTLAQVCADIPGNVNATTVVNSVLRAYVDVMSATVPLNTSYALLLFVDGVQQDGAFRRLKTPPYGESFFGAANQLSPGAHKFELKGYVQGSGEIRLGLTFLHAIGAPAASYPAAKDTKPGGTAVTTAWTKVTNDVTLALPYASDLALQGHITVASQSAASAPITLCFSLDNVSCPTTTWSTVVNWQNVYPNDYNILNAKMFATAGTHTVSMWAKTGSGTASITSGEVEVNSFPTGQGLNKNYPDTVQAGTPLTIYSGRGPNPGDPTQPIAPIFYFGSGGRWTKVLTTTIPGISLPDGSALNGDIEAYVELLGGPDYGPTLGDIGFEFVQGAAAFDVGLGAFYIARDGVYRFGEIRGGTANPTTINMWIRQRDEDAYPCTHEPCSFQVGKRYMTVRLVPQDPAACMYN